MSTGSGCDKIDSKISDAQQLTNTEKGNVTYIDIYDVLFSQVSTLYNQTNEWWVLQYWVFVSLGTLGSDSADAQAERKVSQQNI